MKFLVHLLSLSNKRKANTFGYIQCIQLLFGLGHFCEYESVLFCMEWIHLHTFIHFHTFGYIQNKYISVFICHDCNTIYTVHCKKGTEYTSKGNKRCTELLSIRGEEKGKYFYDYWKMGIKWDSLFQCSFFFPFLTRLSDLIKLVTMWWRGLQQLKKTVLVELQKQKFCYCFLQQQAQQSLSNAKLLCRTPKVR